jgi:GMP synthase-like glutamine amidotransferase
MHAHCFQHVSFEGMGAIEPWLIQKGFTISYTSFFENQVLPDIRTIDCLIVMGGPMSVNDEEQYPWLVAEKQFIRDCIAQRKAVIGICLGAQLIASAMGSKIYRNEVKEIGWFPVIRKITNNFTQAVQFPERITVFHWHGETFDLPEGATLIASSEQCRNQIFMLGSKVIGFQCHLETTDLSLNALIENCANEIIPAPYIQTADEMRKQYNVHGNKMREVLYGVLEEINFN